VSIPRITTNISREEIGILDPKDVNGLEDGDVNMDRAASVSESIGGTVTGTGTERDELDSVNDHSGGESEAASEGSRRKPSRRRAIAVKQAQQEAEAKEKKLELAKEMQQAKLKKAESKQQLNDRKRLIEEEESLAKREKQYELDFRSYINALRPRPMGQDRFCNKIWWMDGMGSHSLIGPNGQIAYGTGRLYIQGCTSDELEIARKAVFVPAEELEESRERVEGEGRLQPGEWAVYDTVEQVSHLTLAPLTIALHFPRLAQPQRLA
jgi:bromodomain adjacent to zinc finger domain protein 1A